MNPDFDEILAGIRDEKPDLAAAEAAAERVWGRISRIRSCADFQALFPAYREGALPEARKLLLVDHLHECVACRKALHGEKVVELAPRKAWRFAPVYKWAIAAAVLLGAGFAVWNYAGPAVGSSAVVQAAEGPLHRVAWSGVRPLAAGETVAGREGIRTGKGASAVLRLKDGSLVEMRERTELSLTERSRDITVHVDRGAVIVQAAKRRFGHLYVGTQDCTVSVTGTIFSVNRGMKGSRVSVVEGAVLVAQGASQHTLRAGDQYSTNPSLGRVPVEEEVAWSRNFDNYMALLREFQTIQKKLEAVPGPGLRYSSRIIDLLPENTVLYASIPNLGRTLGEAERVLRERMAESEVLREWWQTGEKQRLFEKVRALSEYLGDEIVLTATLKAPGQLREPVILAQVTRPGFREFVRAELGKDFQVRGDLAVMSPDAKALERIGSGGFTGTPFYSRIAEAYRDGAGLLVCADLEKIAGFKRLNVKYLVVEQKESETRALVSFAGARRGIASWLAAPAAMGSLDFVSPEAGFVAAFVVKSPAAVLDDVFEMYESSDAQFRQHLADAESKLGVSLRGDLAASLGGEFAVAMDGPALPTPSWKLAAEVYDPARLQMALERMVPAIARESNKNLRLDREQAAGRTYYTLRIPERGPLAEAHYTFVDGYLVAAPNRPLLDKAIQYRATGYTLPRSGGFAALVPKDRHANFSAVIYQNLGPMVGPAVETLGSLTLTPEQQKQVETLAANAKPTLICAYGGPDRIEVATSGSLFGLGLSNLLGVGGPAGLPSMFGAPKKRR